MKPSIVFDMGSGSLARTAGLVMVMFLFHENCQSCSNGLVNKVVFEISELWSGLRALWCSSTGWLNLSVYNEAFDNNVNIFVSEWLSIAWQRNWEWLYLAKVRRA